MTGSDVLQMQFDRLAQEFQHTLKGLGAAKLAWRPAPRANDIGAMLWHSARAWDGYLFYLDRGADVFTPEWATRFKMRELPKSGFDGAFTEAQVACMRAQPKLFLEYVEAIHARTKNFLDSVTPEQLSTLVQIRWWPEEKPKAFVLAHIIRHSYEHLGEAQYVKGLMKEKSGKLKAKIKIPNPKFQNPKRKT